MKIVRCESCGDFVIPKKEMAPLQCDCGLCIAWWRILSEGFLSVWHARGPESCSVVWIPDEFWNERRESVMALRLPRLREDYRFEEPKFLMGWPMVKAALLEASKKEELSKHS